MLNFLGGTLTLIQYKIILRVTYLCCFVCMCFVISLLLFFNSVIKCDS